jgi:hypothetical protein
MWCARLVAHSTRLTLRTWFGIAGGVSVIWAAFAMGCSAENESDEPPLRNRGGSATSNNGGSSNTAGGTGGRASGAGGSAGVGGSGMAGSNALGSSGGRVNEPDAGPDPDPTAGVGFVEDVWPIFMSECGPCHTTQDRENVQVGSANVDRAFADAVRLGGRLISRINGGGMPFGCEGDPGDPGCLTVAQLETIQAWAAAGRPKNRP